VADEGNRAIFVNDRMARMLGYEAHEMAGRALQEFVLDDEIAMAAPPEDRAIHSREVRLTARGGRVVWTLMNTSPLHNGKGQVVGVLTMVVDITTRKAAEEALRQSEQRLKTIIETEPACVKLVSTDGRLLEMNRAGLQMIDADDLSQVLGADIAQLAHPDDRARFVEAMKAASEGTYATAEFRAVGLKGTQRWLKMHAVPFDRSSIERGRTSVVLSVTHNLTQRKLLEHELHQSQKLEAVGRLAGGVAHDFNNLLTAILGYCDFAEMQLPKHHPALGELGQIRAAGERVVALTAQLLAFSRKQILKPRVMDVNQTVTGLLMILPRIIGEHIATSIELDPRLLGLAAEPSVNDRAASYAFGPNAGITEILIPAGYVRTVYDPTFELATDRHGRKFYLGKTSTTPVEIPAPGLPFSINFLAEPGMEHLVIKAASAYQAASKRRVPPPAFGAVEGEP
jgi:PAS domain S-box-containing protein